MARPKNLAKEIEQSSLERVRPRRDQIRHPHVATVYAAMGHPDVAESLAEPLLPYLRARVCRVPRPPKENRVGISARYRAQVSGEPTPSPDASVAKATA
jgi:hypothetical protein